MGRLSLAVLATLLFTASCGAAAPSASATLTVNDPWARPGIKATAPMGGAMAGGMAGGAPMGGAAGNSAVYFTIENGTATADRLLGAESEVAASTELHTVSMVNGVMEMRPIEAIDVPAKSSVTLRPGGLHVMLIGLKNDLKVGDVVRLTLRFEKSGTMKLEAAVREPAG
jgi:copper(I)-binding protein